MGPPGVGTASAGAIARRGPGVAMEEARPVMDEAGCLRLADSPTLLWRKLAKFRLIEVQKCAIRGHLT